MSESMVERPYTLEECARKWESWTKDLGEREAVLTAWVAEEEVRYLDAYSEDPANPPVGDMIRFIFPLLHHTVPTLVDNMEPGFMEIVESFDSQLDEICAVRGLGCVIYDRPPEESVKKVLGPLAERVQMALKSFQQAS